MHHVLYGIIIASYGAPCVFDVLTMLCSIRIQVLAFVVFSDTSRLSCT